MKIEAQQAMRKGFEDEISHYNKTATPKIVLRPEVAGEGRKGVLKQIQQLRAAVANKPRAIVIQPTDNSALAGGLQESNRRGIPVIAYDQYIVNGNLTAFVTSDNYQAGVDNAEYVLKAFPKDQKIRIVVFEYPQVSSTMERVDGFFDTFRLKNREFRVLKKYQAVDPESGASAAKDFLKDFPEKNSVDLIFTVNDGGGLAIVQALVEKKRTEIKHVTFDGAPSAIENLKQGRLTIINSAQFGAELGRQSAKALIANLRNQKTFHKKLIPTFPITHQNWKSWPGFSGDPAKTAGVRDVYPVKASRSKVSINKERNKNLTFKVGVAPLCPYLCNLGKGRWEGYIYDILQDVSETYGITFQIESIPNTRLLSNLTTRKVQYAIMPSFMTRYRSDIRTGGPSLGVSYVGALLPLAEKVEAIDREFLVRKDLIYADLGDDGQSDGALKALKGKVTKLSGFDVSERMIRMLSDRRAQVALADFNVLQYYTSRNQSVVLNLLPTSLSGFSSLALVSNPKDPQFEKLSLYMDDWMDEARKSGKLEKILLKYNLKDWSIFLRD